MRIGIDIDGVVADSYAAWLHELNSYFKKNIAVIDSHEIHLVYDVPWNEMNDFFVFNREKLFMMPEPMAGAKSTIESFIAAGHEIIYVTARLPEEENVTRRWMKRHEIPHHDIVFTGFKCKSNVARQWQLDLFIEDFLVNAQKIAETGIPVLLLDASYNQGREGQLVTRCQGWPDVAAKTLETGFLPVEE